MLSLAKYQNVGEVGGQFESVDLDLFVRLNGVVYVTVRRPCVCVCVCVCVRARSEKLSKRMKSSILHTLC